MAVQRQLEPDPTQVVPPQRRLHVVSPPPRRRRRSHLLAVVAAVLYASAAGIAYGIVTGVLDADDTGGVPGVAGVAVDASGQPSPAGARSTGEDLLTLRTLAARAQQSVFTIEGAGGSTGSGFVAWVKQGQSYLVTAHAAVNGVLADGFRTVFVRRDGRFWTGRIVAADEANGVALVRVDTEIADPLWQARKSEPLADGTQVVAVPAGPDSAFGEGLVAPAEKGRYVLEAGVEQETLGAAVIASNGRIAGVVVATEPGVSTIAPVEVACAQLRRCR